MSSSRSVAAARARRSNESAQYPPRPTGPGHSIHSGANFSQPPPPTQTNHNYRQPNVTTAPPKQSAYVPPIQNAFETNAPIPPYPSKVSIQDAIGVLSTRIARVESFMHNFNLESPNVPQTNAPQTNRGGQMDDSLLRNIIARLDVLEKEKRTPIVNMAPAAAPANNNHSSEIHQMNQELKQVKEELKDTSKMLTTLQSFTMETNQKLVTLLFQDTNDMQVDSYSETMFDNGDGIALDTTDINDINEFEVNIPDGQFSSGSLKDSINEELSKLAL